MSKKVKEIPFANIEGEWQLGSYFFGAQFCPAVRQDGNGDFSIRVVRSERRSGPDLTTWYDYFKLAADGTVLSAPRGYAKDYKPGRVTGLDDAVAKYSAPDRSTARPGL